MGSPAKILIIEDSQDLAELYRKALSTPAVVVDLAPGGDVDFCAEQLGTYGAIIIDLSLPLVSGLDVTKKLRQRGYTGKIIAISGTDHEGVRTACLLSG